MEIFWMQMLQVRFDIEHLSQRFDIRKFLGNQLTDPRNFLQIINEHFWVQFVYLILYNQMLKCEFQSF
jgi:hypothetical protein